jgi:branched-subunit amino acid aminotransferase/4-amino-4-deoxychorismate lyase
LPLDDIQTNKVIVSKIVQIQRTMLYHKTTYRPWYQGAMEKIKKQDIFDELFLTKKANDRRRKEQHYFTY